MRFFLLFAVLLVLRLAAADERTAVEGAKVRISVTHDGDQPCRYQWYKDGKPIPRATAPWILMKRAKRTDAGKYTVQVSNSAGQTLSDVGVLHVEPRVGPAPTPKRAPTGT